MTIANDPSSFDVIVLGAGISGLVSASILVEQGAARVLVVDEYARVGGNHTDRTHGPYTFDVGSPIFQDDSPCCSTFRGCCRATCRSSRPGAGSTRRER